MADWPYNTARWQRLRKRHLQLEPLCRGCKPRIVAANTVDHVQPISDGGEPFPDHDGLASYCAGCHSAKTARGTEAGAVRSDRPRKGCDANGNPIDPTHPWAAGSFIKDAPKLNGGRSGLQNRAPKRPPRILQTQLVRNGERNG
jgi:5-methylcytosine-specific restriction enzyme A